MRKLTFVAVACLILSAAVIVAAPQDLQLSTEPSDPRELEACVVKVLDELLLPAKETGVLVSLDAKEGAQVEKDEVIGQIDDQLAQLDKDFAAYEYQAAKKEAESTVEVELAEKGMLVAQANLEDAVEANKRKAGTFSDAQLRVRQFELDRADAQYRFSQHQKEVARLAAFAKLQQLKRATAMYERRKVTSPISGEVVEMFKHVGEWVNPGDPICRIVRMDKLRVKGMAKVATWARYDLLGRSVRIEVNVPGGQTETVRGVITHTNQVVAGGDEFEVWAEIDNRMVKNTWLITPELTARMVVEGQAAAGVNTPDAGNLRREQRGESLRSASR